MDRAGSSGTAWSDPAGGVGTEGGRRPTGVPTPPAAAAAEGEVFQAPVDTEVSEHPTRRRFTAEYKVRILQEAEGCHRPGELGALLRREGLYSSHLLAWRKQREQATLRGLAPRKRGRKARELSPLLKENQTLRKQNERLTNELRKAQIIIDVQKKLSDALGLTPPIDDWSENNE